MIYLSGHGGLVRYGLGRMLAPTRRNKPLEPGLPWAADTGCFATPEAYSDHWYLGWLERMTPYRDRCLFATAPDSWGDGQATYRLSAPLLGAIRELGYPAAYVLQPGTPDPPWDELDAVFLGGEDAWQRSERVQVLVREAKDRGKWAHRGRVNGVERILASKAMGFDSCDGTAVRWGPDRHGPMIARAEARARAQLVLV